MFRAGSRQPKAVPLSLITRLEEIDAHKIELSNGRHMVQYRGQLMPLDQHERRRARQGRGRAAAAGVLRRQPLDGARGRRDRRHRRRQLDIQVASDNPGVLGSAIIKGQATEIIDVGHFLPLAFEDWFRRKEQAVRAARARCCWSTTRRSSATCSRRCCRPRAMQVTAVGFGARGAGRCSKTDRAFDVVITDIEMPEMDGFELAEAVRADPRTAELPIIALSSMVSAEAIERGRQVGFHDYRRQVRPSGPDRGAQGTDRRLGRAA